MNALPADQAAAVIPRPAATTLVLRDGPAGLEVLMVRRSPNASFMPGAYVFPGGAVDAADASAGPACDESAAALAQRVGRVTQVGDDALAFAVAALRECFEECGLWLGAAEHPFERSTEPAAGWAALRARLHGGQAIAALAASAGLRLATSVLQPWSHWVTPLGLPKRFDTLFFVARAPQGQLPSVDEGETTTLAWVHPPAALAEQAAGGFAMEFATVRTVESLLPFCQGGPGAAGTVQALLDHAAALRQLPPLHPRLRRGEGGRVLGVLLPGQPGYDAAQ